MLLKELNVLSLSSNQHDVATFQTVFKQWDGKSLLPTPNVVTEEELNTYKLRLKLCIEETFELFEAMLSPEAYKPFDSILNDVNTKIDSITEEQLTVDPIAVFDSLVDQEVVNLGLANLLGLDMQEGFKEVHKSNMTKLDKDGNPVFREDGKLLKSDLFVHPDLESVYNSTSFKFTPSEE